MTRLDYETPPPKTSRVRDDVAYFLPMGIFLVLVWVGGQRAEWYIPSYAARAVIVAMALSLLWPHFTKIRWNYWWLGIVVGVIGIFQWVGMQLWLQAHFAFFRPSPGGFDPSTLGYGSRWFWIFVALRMIGAVLVVPVMEELFWRDWLWRTVIAPNDFKLADVGERDWKAFLVVSGMFAFVHGNWGATAVVWALMVGALLMYTRSLGACIIAHATTNLLLALYVLYTRDWSFW